jgi:hypothetical protein
MVMRNEIREMFETLWPSCGTSANTTAMNARLAGPK